MSQKCNKLNKVIQDSRRQGDGCPHHTDIVDKGQSPSSLRAYYPDRRSDWPSGRYCCSFCRWCG